MREIKLRFWDKENNCMVYQNKGSLYPLSLYKIVCDCFTNFKFRLFRLKNNNLNQFEEVESIKMQYTGLKDINEVEIYEGDIVNYFKDELAVIKFIHGCFVIESSKYDEVFGDICADIEVIGNIYENPELLEEV